MKFKDCKCDFVMKLKTFEMFQIYEFLFLPESGQSYLKCDNMDAIDSQCSLVTVKIKFYR